MRVALVCPYSLSLPGGVQGQVLALARALRALGHEVRVLGPSDGPPLDVNVTTLGRCIPTDINGSVAPIAPGLACVMRTLRALREEEFDVLHLHEPLSPGPTLTSLVMGSRPMVGTFHAAGGVGAYRFLHPLARWLSQRLSVRCAVSQEARAMAFANIGGHYEVLHNGIELDWAASAEPWPTAGPTVLFCSRHEQRKGLGVLIEAMEHLSADVRLWVDSDGPETTRLKAATAGDGRIEWLGRIDEGEK
ncbi:MAG: glycosyltransferase family 4 protein, partial [Pseudonocardiaceae bacterium]